MRIAAEKGIDLFRLAISTTRRLVFLLVFMVSNFFYQYFASGNIYQAMILGVIGGFVLLFSLVIRHEQTSKYQNDLKELNKYASGVVFKLKAGKNVSDALKESCGQVDAGIRKDVKETIQLLSESQSIQTNHFRKYDFPSLNIFHQILSIKYIYGGNAGELFHQILKDMAFEIKKRDELFRKKTFSAMQVMMMVLMVAALPIFLKFTASNVYAIFQKMFLSQILLLMFHTVLLLLVRSLQKEKCDISIRL